ncbi:hypothetical protein ABL118_004632 [Vibrio alginolyticus]
MEELFREFIATVNPAELVPMFILLVMLVSRALREDVLKVFRLFFYRDENSSTGTQSVDRLSKLEKQIKELERGIAKGALDQKSALIEKEVSSYIDENLKNVVGKKIQDTELIKDTVLQNLHDDVRNEIQTLIKDRELIEVERTASFQEENRLKIRSHNSLIDTLEKEARNASMLKMVMINLFVVSTLAFLIFNIFNETQLPQNSYFLILGVYFSLGAFMLYIIRTSHFRSSVLLAIKEDERNHQNAIEYLQKIKGSAELTEHDVDIIRLIMTNRAEREHKANHPYEVILKGVSGTNIQFKGGKMSLGGNNADKA